VWWSAPAPWASAGPHIPGSHGMPTGPGGAPSWARGCAGVAVGGPIGRERSSEPRVCPHLSLSATGSPHVACQHARQIYVWNRAPTVGSPGVASGRGVRALARRPGAPAWPRAGPARGTRTGLKRHLRRSELADFTLAVSSCHKPGGPGHIPGTGGDLAGDASRHARVRPPSLRERVPTPTRATALPSARGTRLIHARVRVCARTRESSSGLRARERRRPPPRWAAGVGRLGSVVVRVSLRRTGGSACGGDPRARVRRATGGDQAQARRCPAHRT
jgi:hypothetical protein